MTPRKTIATKSVFIAPLLSAVAVTTLLGISARDAAAEPYMAVREGWACSACHTNRSGGGMRNLTVEMHAPQILNLPNDGKGIFPDPPERFSPNINDYFSVGADMRLVDTLLFQDKPNQDGRVPNNTIGRPLESNSLDVNQATVYADLRLLPGYLNVYVDQRFAPGGASNREAWAMIENVISGEVYLKGGQFFPAWGLRIQDDTAFVNSDTGLGFQRNLQGVEIGRTTEKLSLYAQVADGIGGGKFPFLVGNASYMWDKVGPFQGLYLGGSVAYNEPDGGRLGEYTGYAGFSVGPLAVLGQGVLVDSKDDGDSNQQWIAYAEANWLLFGWINTKFAFDWTDPDQSASDDARNRFSIGLEPFLDQFLQVRLFYRVYNGPKNNLSANRDELLLEAHLFF